MGDLRSGWRREKKKLVEGCRLLDVSFFIRYEHFPLRRDDSGAMEWPNGFVVRFRSDLTDRDHPAFVIDYTAAGNPVRLTVPVSSTRPHYGGSRWWLHCPACFHRVASLYLPAREDVFLCRGCHKLTYVKRQEKWRYKAGYRIFGEMTGTNETVARRPLDGRRRLRSRKRTKKLGADVELMVLLQRFRLDVLRDDED